MIKPLHLDGMDYTPEVLGNIKENLITLRDNALRENGFQVSLLLSHTIAAINYLAENTIHSGGTVEQDSLQ